MFSGLESMVPLQDEKILEALHSKNVREVEHELNKSRAQMEWEGEKLRLQKEKDISEHRRRQLLAYRIGTAHAVYAQRYDVALLELN